MSEVADNQNNDHAETTSPVKRTAGFRVSSPQYQLYACRSRLCVSQGAVSRHIATLESWLDVKLFTRMNRGISLTPQGRIYFDSIKVAFDAIETSTSQMKQHPDQDRLKLKLPPTFAMRWLVPRLAHFNALHPDIDVQITTSHQPADFDREDIDMCIYSWPEPPVGHNHGHLFGEVLLLVCAPGYLKHAPDLKKAQDLN